MEPSTKKRRHGSSSRKDLQDEDDDDELASHPQEIRIRRDPDIQFALKRANADHKLQSTMAHIIEKYSRNFEGIGDEIDMQTGEIVVNNGHLRSMRDEGDVEGLWVEGDSNIDEDEGILLGDLTDEYSEDEEQVNEVQDSQNDDENSQPSTTKEQDTHTDMKDQGTNIDQTPKSDPKTTNNSDPSPRNEISEPPFNPKPHGDPPPFGPSASLGYGQSPPGFGPWGMVPGFPMQAWGRDDIPPYFNMPYSMPGPWFTGGRYDFPTNNGQTSIWGRSWAKRTKRAGSMKGPSKHSPNKGTDTTTVHEGDDVTHGNVKRSSKPKEQEPHSQEFSSSDRTINATDEDDDLMLSGIADPVPPIEPSLIPPVEESLAKDNAQTHPENVLEERGEISVEVLHQQKETDDTGRRRSGRARKQTEYMGKISWNDAKQWRKSCQTLSVELYRANPSVRGEYRSVDQSIDNIEEERDLPLGKKQINESPIEESQADVVVQKQVIPDSQDTATPFNSSAPEAPQSRETDNKTNGSGHLPTMELSDDEAPLVLSRIKAPRRHAGTSSTITHLPEEPSARDVEPVLSRVNSPARTTKEVTPRVETSVMEVFDQATQSLKRKRGRPRRSTITGRPASPAIRAEPAPLSNVKFASFITTNGLAADSCPNQQNRRAGRPRKSEVASLEAEAETQYLSGETAPSQGSVHSDEVTQRTPGDKDLDSEAPQTSPHLTHELKWLIKTRPNSHASDKHVRPRRSREQLQQGKDAKAASTEVGLEKPKEDTEKERAISDKHLTSQRQQKLLSETDTAMEEAPENGETPKVQEDQPDTTTPASPIHNKGTHDNDYSYNGQESLNDNAFSDHGVPEDGLTPDEEECLPTLPDETTIQEVSTPRKPKDTLAPLLEPPSSSQRPRTPRHTSILTTRAPSSRRSLLSFVSDSESDTDGSRDELTRRVKSASKTTSIRPSTKKVWHSTTLTREIHRTPSKRRLHSMSSPVGVIRTPGGTVQTCGVDGFQCGRDYCFTCI
ncbi:hypothetical protein ACHAPA_001201 [Fusarium lateritium]